MVAIALDICGRRYAVECDDGQEERLRELGARFDVHARTLEDQVGKLPEAMLLLLAGLMVADEITDSSQRLREAERDIDQLRGRLAKYETGGAHSDAKRAFTALMRAADRIESMADEIDPAISGKNS